MVLLLSLILLLPISVSGITIEEFTDLDTVEIQGENINVALIKDFIRETENELISAFSEITDSRIESFENKIDEISDMIQTKIVLGFISLCLFILNIFLAKKLIIDLVFENG